MGVLATPQVNQLTMQFALVVLCAVLACAQANDYNPGHNVYGGSGYGGYAGSPAYGSAYVRNYGPGYTPYGYLDRYGYGEYYTGYGNQYTTTNPAFGKIPAGYRAGYGVANGYNAGYGATGYNAGYGATGYYAGYEATGYNAGYGATGYNAGYGATGYGAHGSV